MRKIIGIVHPFDAQQILYVYEDGNKLTFTKVSLKDMPDLILKLSEQYEVEEVNLSGAKSFNQKLVQEIQQQEILKYNKNKLQIKCI